MLKIPHESIRNGQESWSPEVENAGHSTVAGLENFPDENPNPVMRWSKNGRLLYANRASQSFLKCWNHELERGEGLALLLATAGNDAIHYTDINCGDKVYKVAFRSIKGNDFVNVYAIDATAEKRTSQDLAAALAQLNKFHYAPNHDIKSLLSEETDRIKSNIIIGTSEPHRRLLAKIAKVAKTHATVLITGETGTGKELIANAIHSSSLLKDKKLVKVNCAALPSGLIESELFGHVKGAFTGAMSSKIGRFEQAAGGTIFLDEIGDLAPELQAKLLRVLQEGEMQRVGGDRSIPVDVRVIAATNQILPELMAKGRFREDLYYRLNVFPIESAALRNRKDDIAALAIHFLEKYCAKTGKWMEPLDSSNIGQLEAYHWPGNVRELENIIERAVILTEGNRLQLDEAFDNYMTSDITLSKKTLKEVEKEMIRAALKDSAGKIEGQTGAATRLDMAPSTLRERIKKYGLNRFNQSTNNPLQNNLGP